MKKIWLTAAGVALAGASTLATMPANAFWGSWGGNDWYGGPWHGGPWWGGYPYYGGWGGYPHHGGWGGYPYGGGWGSPWGGWGGPWGGYGYPMYGAYPHAVAPAPVAPAASGAEK